MIYNYIYLNGYIYLFLDYFVYNSRLLFLLLVFIFIFNYKCYCWKNNVVVCGKSIWY